MADESTLIAEFKSITQENDERSRFFLESANWQLQVALSNFYDSTVNTGSDDGEDMAPHDPPVRDSPNDMDVDHQDAVRNTENVTKVKPARSSQGNSRFRSLADYADKQEADSDEDEGQQFYAGGSEHSGEVILGPGKKKKGEEIVAKMFKDAKKHGAVPVEESHSSNAKHGATYFSGGGYKLGQTDDDHEFVPGAASNRTEDRKLIVILKLWKNGFSVDDGPLRDYNNEENREFLQSIMKGEIPKELIQLAKGGEVSLDMEDHKTEDYKVEKKALKPFTGHGYTLGNVTPVVVSRDTASSAEAQVSSVDPPVTIEADAPVTTIRVQMGDGSRVTQKFNHSHTVEDVYSFVRNRNPTSRAFVLMTTFPNKELTEDGSSLKESNLLNAVIVQRFKG